MKSSLSYCGQVVRENDPDRFLLSLFAPANRRESLWALFAFNYEIARTREIVSETQLGLIRLQWWREEIGKIYDGGAISGHEVLGVLAEAIKAHHLPRGMFETLIYAREFDLEGRPPSNMDGFLNYADFTSTPLLSLALIVCGDDPDMEAVAAVAVNYALAGLLRAIPFHAAQGRSYLPEDMMKASAGTIPEVVKGVAGQFVPGIRPVSRFLRAVQGLAAIYMIQLHRCVYDPYNRKMAVPPAFREIRLALWTGF